MLSNLFSGVLSHLDAQAKVTAGRNAVAVIADDDDVTVVRPRERRMY